MTFSASGMRPPLNAKATKGTASGALLVKNVAGELADVGIYRAPFLDRSDDRGKIVVCQDQVRSLLGDVGAGQPHCHADVGLLKCRGVVDAVAGDGDHVALLSAAQ